MEVDQATHFTRNFVPLQRDQSRPKNFYKTLLATIISQATNLGVVAMSESVAGMSIDMLRHVLKHYIREKTLTGANADIVNHHHQLSLSAVHGTGECSSSELHGRDKTKLPEEKQPDLKADFDKTKEEGERVIEAEKEKKREDTFRAFRELAEEVTREKDTEREDDTDRGDTEEDEFRVFGADKGREDRGRERSSKERRIDYDDDEDDEEGDDDDEGFKPPPTPPKTGF